MFDRDGGGLEPQHPRGALRVVAGGGDHMFGADHHAFLGGHEVAAAFGHLGDLHLPVIAMPCIAVDLPLAFDQHATLPRALGHGHGHVGGVDIAVGGMEQRAQQILGAHQRPALLDLRRGQEFMRHVAGFGGGGIEPVFVHARLRLCHPQVAHHEEACIKPGLLLQRLVELDGVVVDMRGGIGHVEIGQQARGMPCGSCGQLVPFQQHDIRPARPGQMIGDGGAHRAAADHQCFDFRLHDMRSPQVFPLNSARRHIRRVRPDLS